ncbi:MAG: ABC transporter permease subunit [Lachnospiraceae bacterium]|nr:ABC transporter permease subunit [Lachnospiraceae bacterium]
MKWDKKEKNRQIFQRAGAVLFALALWQFLAMRLNLNILLVSPVEVGARLLTIWREEGFFTSLWFTFYHIAGGFFLGLFLGIALAFLSSRFSLLEILLSPFLSAIKAVPVASFVVICLIWLKASNLSVFISFLIVFPVIYGNVLTGIKNLDKDLLEMADVFEIRGFYRLKGIILPLLAPYLLSAASVSCGMAWKAGVAAEIIGIPNGSIGKNLQQAKIYLDTDDLSAWTVIIVIVSAAFEKVFILLLKRILGADRTIGKGGRDVA